MSKVIEADDEPQHLLLNNIYFVASITHCFAPYHLDAVIADSKINSIMGPVNLRMNLLLVMVIGKQIQPIPYMIQFAILYFAWKVVIKTFSSIFDILHCSFDYAFLERGMKMVFQLQKLTSHWVPCSTVSRNWMSSMSFD